MHATRLLELLLTAHSTGYLEMLPHADPISAHLVSIVLKCEEKVCPERDLVPVREERPLLQVTYEPSNGEVI